jgi:hypothetical protein
MAAVTKTYDYVLGATPYTVDVTVDIPSTCTGLASQDPNVQDGERDITITLSEALSFNLLVRLEVTRNRVDQYGSSQSVYDIYAVVPQGQTSYVATKECYKYRYDPFTTFFTEEDWSHVFADQQAPQTGAGPLTAEVSSQVDQSCSGTEDGTIILNVFGGDPPYSYAWADAPGLDVSERFALLAGTYNVTVTDDSANVTSLEVTIGLNSPAIDTPTPTITNVSCYGGDDGAVTFPALTGGTAPLTMTWGDGIVGINRNTLSVGTYTYTISDALGCSRTFSLTITQPERLTVTVNQSGRNVEMDIAGGTAPYTYLWDDGSPDSTSRDRYILPNGSYIFTVTDANGCAQSVSVVVQDIKFYFSKNPIWLSLQAASPEAKDNLSFVCEVYLEEDYLSDTFAKKYESEHPARTDGSTYFNVEQVLNSFMSAAVPTFGDTAILRVPEVFKRFYLRYFEKYGTPPTPAAATQIDTFYVLFGGLSDQEFAKDVFFDTYLQEQRPFLSWQPQEVSIADDQHAYLHFVVAVPGYTSITQRITVQFTDGQVVSFDFGTVSGVQPFEVYRFPAGVEQLGLDVMDPDKVIDTYDIQLFSGQDAVSEQRSYWVRPTRKHYRKLIYLNSLGAWDHLLCMGRGSESIRTSEETISRELPVDFSYADRRNITVSKNGQITARAVVDSLNGQERKHLIDLSISEEVYEQTASGYLPVKVKFDFDPRDDFQNIDLISLDIIYPSIRRYTPEL